MNKSSCFHRVALHSSLEVSDIEDVRRSGQFYIHAPHEHVGGVLDMANQISGKQKQGQKGMSCAAASMEEKTSFGGEIGSCEILPLLLNLWALVLLLNIY